MYRYKQTILSIANYSAATGNIRSYNWPTTGSGVNSSNWDIGTATGFLGSLSPTSAKRALIPVFCSKRAVSRKSPTPLSQSMWEANIKG
ncbi:MAG: hypothetical protein NUV74_11300 [Candidatus Brocadiaceae bacterium]|nr:hypothetical protein [Candidatus Brocadiaceae bacterium]